MKALQLLLLPSLALLAGACRSADGASASGSSAPAPAAAPATPEPSELGTFTYTPEHQEARQLHAALQGPLADNGLEVVLLGDTFEARGTSQQLFQARMLLQGFDSPLATSGHRMEGWTFEHRDSRLFLNSARGAGAWGDDWIALAPTQQKLYAWIPDGGAESLSQLVAEYDRAH